MGKLALVRIFSRRVRGDAQLADVTADIGGGYTVTAENLPPAGDDSQPLPGDYALLVSIPGHGREAVAGYVDPANAGTAGPGEKRIYSRDPDTGAPVADVWLKSDGAIVIDNGAGSVTLEAGGDVNINGVVIDTSGNITTTGSVDAPSVVANGKELAEHTHPVTTAPGTTGPNT